MGCVACLTNGACILVAPSIYGPLAVQSYMRPIHNTVLRKRLSILH